MDTGSHRRTGLHRVARALKVRVHPHEGDDPLRFWQERVLRAILAGCMVLGFLTYVPSFWLAVKERLWSVALVDTLMYAWVVLVFVRHDQPYRLRSGSLVAMTYILGLVLLVVVGPFGAGAVWLFSFPVIAGILLGRRMSVAALGLNAVTLAAAGVAIRTGFMHWPIAEINPVAKWTVSSINFMLLDSLTTLSVSVLVHGLRTSLEKETSLRRAVEENEERLKTVIASVHTGIFIIESDTRRIVNANPAAVEMIGAPREAIIGRPCQDYLVETICAQSTVTDGAALHKETELRSTSGQYRPIVVSVEPVVLDGRPHLLASFLDISRLRQAEQDRIYLESELAKARKMEALGTLAGGIAHDFNNILAGLIGYTELARMKTEPGSALDNDLEVVFGAADRARDLVQQILFFSRQDKLNPKPVRVRSVLDEALKLFRATLPSGVELRTRFSDDPVAMIDTTPFHQVLMNLCVNARHAVAASGGVIEVGLEADTAPQKRNQRRFLPPGQTWLHLWVSDNGCGMPASVVERIFEPFFTTRPAGHGSGMGLAVVHGIVTGHGGIIAVESEPDAGTRVSIYLPMSIAGGLRPATGSSMPPASGAERVMVVDDDETVLAITCKMLESLGYIVSTADSGQNALDLLGSTSEAYDLIISDIKMPEMTGLELLASIRERFGPLPVILFTGDSGALTENDARRLGAAALAFKPLDRQKMARLVRSVIDTAGCGSTESDLEN